MMKRLALLLLALTLVAAACGDDDGTATTTAPATTMAPATTQAATTEAPTTTAAATTTEATTTTVDPMAALAALVAEYEGGFGGTWNNTTFGSEGPISGSLNFDPAAMAIVFDIDLGGFVFGAMDPEMETLTFSLAGIELGSGSFTTTASSATFGEVEVTITPNSIEMTAADVPDPGIASMVVSGPFGPEGFELAYVIEFAGGGDPAEGTVSITKNG